MTQSEPTNVRFPGLTAELGKTSFFPDSHVHFAILEFKMSIRRGTQSFQELPGVSPARHNPVGQGAGFVRTAYRKQLCINGPIERSQHLITRAARESETSESLDQIGCKTGRRNRRSKVALWDEIETPRLARDCRGGKTRRTNAKRPASYDTSLSLNQL